MPDSNELARLLAPAIRMPGFLGIALLGSLSANMADDTSDYDFRVVFEDSRLTSDVQALRFESNRPMDYEIVTMSRFRELANDPVRRREMVHAKALCDAAGAVSAAIAEMRTLPPDKARETAAHALDWYYNGVYRSLKCHRHGFRVGFFAMAAQSVEYLNEALFAMDGLVHPFINRFPFVLDVLSCLPLPVPELLRNIEGILCGALPDCQAALYRAVRKQAESRGYGDVIEGWEGLVDYEIVLYEKTKAVI